MSFRIRLTFSPKLESDLFLGNNIDQLSSLITQCIQLLKKFKNISILTIPNEYRSCFHQHKRLKPIIDLIDTTQSNVLFESTQKKSFCNIDCTLSMFENETASIATRKIVNLLSEKNVPILLGLDKHSVKKFVCDTCANKHTCSPIYDASSFLLPQDESSFEIVSTSNAAKSLELYKTIAPPVTSKDLDFLLYATAIANGTPIPSLLTPGSVFFTQDFTNDLRSLGWDDVFLVSYCVYRAAAYPSSQNRKQRTESSIDWHPNDIDECNGFKLFRCDVVEPDKTGIRVSGARRMLFSKYKDKNYFLAYTDTHDFSSQMINQRTLALKKHLSI